MSGFVRGLCRELAERGYVVEDPERAAVGCDDEIAVLDDEVADRRRGKILAQRLPVIAVVERDIDGGFGSCVEQSLANGVLAYDVDGCIIGKSGVDLLPRLSAVVSAVDVRMQIVEPEAIHCGVNCLIVEVRRIELSDLAPWRDAGRCHVAPRFSAVACYVNQAVVGADPDDVRVTI